MTIRWTTRAARELERVAVHLETARAGSGARFLGEVDSTVERIRSLPQGFPRVPGEAEAEVRRALIVRFGYWLIYELREPGQAVVLTIWHSRRRPKAT